MSREIDCGRRSSEGSRKGGNRVEESERMRRVRLARLGVRVGQAQQVGMARMKMKM